MANRELLFVYGSFCEGMAHYNLLSNFIQSKIPARVRGTVYRLEVGYPVLLDEGSEWVDGQLMEVEAPAVLFQLLDEFHGYSRLKPEKSLFFKQSLPVECAGSGEVVEALVYTVNPAKLPRSAERIAGGRWQENLEECPALVERLSERQRNYIRRLGQSRGRQIVPIDLELYRELMKMDLIVDKGRRLALTKLGKEVYRYLPQSVD